VNRGISWSLNLKLVDDASKGLLSFARTNQRVAQQAAKDARDTAAAAKKAADAAVADARRKTAAAAAAAKAAQEAAQDEVRAAETAARAGTKAARDQAAAARSIATAQARAAAAAQKEATTAERAAAARGTAYNRAASAATKASREEMSAARTAAAAQVKASNDVARATARQRASQSTATAGMRSYAKGAAALAAAGVVGAVIKTAGNYDTALREVGAVSGATGKDLAAMGAIARDAGLETGVGATAATKAMAELAKAGLDAEQVGPALAGTLALAQAGGMETADAASAAANALQTFGMEGKETTRVADALANAANLTTADVSDFAMALSQGGSAAKLAGVDFDDTTLSLAQLARIGVKGSDAGTAMKSAFLQLAKPTAAAETAMKKYGLSFFDAQGNMKSVASIGDMLRSKLGGLTSQQRVAVLQTLAGTDGFRTLAATMGMSSKETEKLSRQLGLQGSAADTAAKKQGGFKGAMDRLRASGEELSITVGTPLVNALADGADGISDIVREARKDGTLKDLAKTVGDAAEKVEELADDAIAFGKAHPDLVKAAGGLVAVGLAVKTIRFAGAITGVSSLLKGLGTLTGVGIRAGRRLGGALGDELADTAASRARGGLSSNGALTKGGIRGRMASVGRTLGGLIGLPMGRRAADAASDGLSRNGAITGKAGGRMGSIGRVLGKALGVGLAAAAVVEITNGLHNALDNWTFGDSTGDGRERKEKARDSIADPLGTGSRSGGPLGWLKERLGGREGGTLLSGGGFRRFQEGGLVPALVSSGEALRYPDGTWDTVPGPRVAADNVAAMLPPRTEVYTEHGQGLLASGLGRADVLAQQLPHFAKGGIVEAAKAGRAAGWTGSKLVTGVAIAGPESGYRNTKSLVTGEEDSRGMWQINVKAHPWARALDLTNPYVAAKAAERVRATGRRGWGEWTAYTGDDGRGSDGDWRKFVKQAREAVVASRGSDRTRTGGRSAVPGVSDRTYKVPVTLGTSTTRARDAASGALQAGLDRGSSWSRADIAAYGNPYLRTLRGELDEARDSFTREITVKGRAAKAGSTGKLARLEKSFASRLDGTAGGGTKLRRLTAALGTMQSIAAKGLPYTYGGGHGRLGQPGPGGPGFDCSGYVSAGLGAAGWIKSPMATQQGSGLNTLGTSGAGQFLTWGVRGSSGRGAHTMMKIGNSYWESGSGHGPRRVSGWSGKFAYRHMPGYAKGGIVGRARAVAVRAPAAARRVLETVGDRALDPTAREFVGWGFRRGGAVRRFRAGGITGASISAVSGPIAGRGSTRALDAVLKSTTDRNLAALDAQVAALGSSRLDDLRRYLSERVDAGGDAKTVERVKAALKQVTEQIGYRVSRSALRVAGQLDAANAAVDSIGSQLSMGGIDADSVVGRTTTIDTTRAAQEDARKAEAQARRDLDRAVKNTAGLSPEARKAAIDTAQEQLTAASSAVKGFSESIAAAELDLERNRPKLDAESRDAQIGLRAAQAQLTDDTGDDRQAVVDRQAEAARQYNEASARQDVGWMTQAAQDLASAAGDLKAFDQGQREKARADRDQDLSLAEAMAGLTDDGGADDLAAAKAREAELEKRLAEQQAEKDIAGQIETATALKGVRDAVKSLDTTLQERQASIDMNNDLLRTTLENQQKILAGTAAGTPALASALWAFAAGGAGAGIVRAAGTPSYAGGGSRY
jgi:TP901 family phage tail tape measure protein